MLVYQRVLASTMSRCARNCHLWLFMGGRPCQSSMVFGWRMRCSFLALGYTGEASNHQTRARTRNNDLQISTVLSFPADQILGVKLNLFQMPNVSMSVSMFQFHARTSSTVHDADLHGFGLGLAEFYRGLGQPWL